MTLHAINCPKCGGGIAVSIFEDENGTSYKCGNCEHGFTKPASDEHMSTPPVLPEALAPASKAGDPGAGSVLPDGSDAGRVVVSKHADAGPSVTPVQPTAPPEESHAPSGAGAGGYSS